MRQCSRPGCRGECKDGQYWCNVCKLKGIRASRLRKKDIKLTEEAEEERNLKVLRENILSSSTFTYQDGYILNVTPIDKKFKIEICYDQEEMAILVPPDRAELLKDWLIAKLSNQ